MEFRVSPLSGGGLILFPLAVASPIMQSNKVRVAIQCEDYKARDKEPKVHPVSCDCSFLGNSAGHFSARNVGLLGLGRSQAFLWLRRLR